MYGLFADAGGDVVVTASWWSDIINNVPDGWVAATDV